MTLHQRPGTTTRVAQIRHSIQRFAYLGLVLAAFALMMLGKAETIMVEKVRAHLNDAVAPILNAMSRPAATVREIVDEGRHVFNLYQENTRLREENARLLQWQTVARKVESENEQLRALAAMPRSPATSYITGRIIADKGGTYSQSVLIYAGVRDGVKNGHAVITAQGLVGRISGVAERSSRVLLITDLNSRIPVMIENSRTRALTAGRNKDLPTLIHLPPGALVAPGDRIITSGHGGAFPEGIPVGVVAAVEDNLVTVQPFTDSNRIELVQIVDYGLDGILNRETMTTALPEPVKAAPQAPQGAIVPSGRPSTP